MLRLVWLLHHHGGGVVRQVVSRGVPDRAVIHHLPSHLSLDDVRFLWNVCVLLLLPIDPTALLMTLVVQDDSRVDLGISNTPVLHLLVADLLESEGKEGAEDGADEDDEEYYHNDHTHVDRIGQIWWTFFNYLASKSNIRQQGA